MITDNRFVVLFSYLAMIEKERLKPEHLDFVKQLCEDSQISWTEQRKEFAKKTLETITKRRKPKDPKPKPKPKKPKN